MQYKSLMTETQPLLVIRGSVSRQGRPVEAAYVDLLDPQETFIAERRTGADGEYSFHTTPGRWVLVCRSSGSEPVRHEVDGTGELRVDFQLA